MSRLNPDYARRDEMPAERLRIAVVGAGYWGPNLARNFAQSPDWDLAAVCDLDGERARVVADRVGAASTSSLDEVFNPRLRRGKKKNLAAAAKRRQEAARKLEEEMKAPAGVTEVIV